MVLDYTGQRTLAWPTQAVEGEVILVERTRVLKWNQHVD
tara:strand:+ start:326 stop:442 length:117 start_codon:yes stop_codon:yes gene_type:complete